MTDEPNDDFAYQSELWAKLGEEIAAAALDVTPTEKALAYDRWVTRAEDIYKRKAETKPDIIRRP